MFWRLSLLQVTLKTTCKETGPRSISSIVLHHRSIFCTAGGLLCGVIIHGSNRGDCRRLCVCHPPDCGLLPDLLPAHLRLCLQLYDQVPHLCRCLNDTEMCAALVPCSPLLGPLGYRVQFSLRMQKVLHVLAATARLIRHAHAGYARPLLLYCCMRVPSTCSVWQCQHRMRPFCCSAGNAPPCRSKQA